MQTYLLSLGRFYFTSYTGLSKSCWRGIILSLIESTLIGVYYYLSIYFIGVLHLSISTSGMIISCYGIGAILGGILSGKLSDKTSPSIVSAFSLLIQAAAYLALIKLKSIELLMCDVFIIGIATYSFITSNHLWVLSQCKNNEAQRLKAINILSTSSNLGLGLSAIIISEVAHFGFQYIFLTSGSVIFLLSCFLFRQEGRINKMESSDKIEEKFINELSIKKKNKLIMTLVLLSVLFVGSIVAQLNSTYAIYIQESFPHLGIKAISILFALNSFLVVFIETPLGNFLKNHNKILMIGIGGFLIGFGMFMLIFSYSFVLAIIACIIYTIGEIIFFCMTQLICYEKGAKKKKGHSLGMYRMVYATSRVIGPASGGLIYTQLGGNMVWYLSGIIGLLCFISCNYFKNYD